MQRKTYCVMELNPKKDEIEHSDVFIETDAEAVPRRVIAEWDVNYTEEEVEKLIGQAKRDIEEAAGVDNLILYCKDDGTTVYITQVWEERAKFEMSWLKTKYRDYRSCYRENTH